LKILKSGIYFSILIIINTLVSCSTERELARDFIKSNKEIPVILLCTDHLILTNDKLKRIPNFDSLDVKTQDSLWQVNTIYLDSLSDNKILTNFYKNLIKELRLYGFKVITSDSLHDSQNVQTNNYILNIAQIEISEDKYPYRDQQLFFGDLMYYYDHTFNEINLNFWFELTDSITKTPKVLFSTFTVNDKLEGGFLMDNLTYKVSYKYKITPFNTEDIYKLANDAAVKASNYFYNYLMNKYIRNNLPSNVQYFKHFSYNRYYDYLYNDDEDNFVEITKE
jgi:hypothetical protein